MAKKIFLSDIHIGTGRKPNQANDCRYRFDWLGQNEAEVLCAFLDYINSRAEAENIEEVILVGDVFDNWIYPIFEVPPTVEDIIKASDSADNAEVIMSLKRLADNPRLKITYLPGNHDIDTQKSDLDRISPKIVYSAEPYKKNGIYAAHGNFFDSFNKENSGNKFPLNYPLGYFISRIVATQTSRTNSSARRWWEFPIDALGSLGEKTFAESIFEGFLKKAGLDWNAEIYMPASYPGDKKIKARDIIDQFKKTSFSTSVEDLYPAANNLETKLNRNRDDYNIIIFGHTHKGKISTLKLVPNTDDTPKSIYANSGSWCEDGEPCTCIVTEEKDTFHVVRLMEWDHHKLRQRDFQTVAFKKI